jgi:hypothetical protein
MMSEKVEKLADNAFLVAVPVYFTVMFDEEGNIRCVEPVGSGPKWVRNGHNSYGNAYKKEPSGLLATAARLARLAYSKVNIA